MSDGIRYDQTYSAGLEPAEINAFYVNMFPMKPQALELPNAVQITNGTREITVERKHA